MTELNSWALIGPGGVGSELANKLADERYATSIGLKSMPEFVVRSSGIVAADLTTSLDVNIADSDEAPDVTFIAMPSTDDGETATNYMNPILDDRKTVITAEKGALANNFGTLRQKSGNFERLGMNASVGGGTRMIDVVKSYTSDLDNVTQMHMALNGTLAAIMSMIAPRDGVGMSLGQAVDQAVTLGYAEPGSQNPYDVIRGEAQGDIPKKTSIIVNSLGLLRESVSWHEFGFTMSDEDIAQVIDESKVRRFIVSLYAEDYVNNLTRSPGDDNVGGFIKDIDGWKVVGGFRHIDRNPLFTPLANITGPGNGLVIGVGKSETDGVYAVTGPGAGVKPTTNSMLHDYIIRRKFIK